MPVDGKARAVLAPVLTYGQKLQRVSVLYAERVYIVCTQPSRVMRVLYADLGNTHTYGWGSK